MARRIKHFGGQHETQPIKDPKQIDELLYYLLNQIESAKSDVKRYQADRNYMLILVGMNTAFRAEDLLQLRVRDVITGYISIKENKTGKPQNFKMNKEFHKEVEAYVQRNNLKEFDYMFMGQKKFIGKIAHILPINRQQGHRIVANAGKAIGINFIFGMHSLRKTFGYQYILSGKKELTLMKMYNHTSTDVTRRYVCWGREDAEADREAVYLGVKHNKAKLKTQTQAKIKMNKRIANGDIFNRCKNKGKCTSCQAVTDADKDKYCWKCGSKLNHRL